ncbi:MAG TPA: hypothetical protein PKY81_08335 [bacterium]|nr:hypothetical protein [bacterium]
MNGGIIKKKTTPAVSFLSNISGYSNLAVYLNLAVFILSVIIYWRAAAAYFVADDFFYIFQRNNLKHYSPFTHFFYQPVTLLVYFLNYFWAGLSHFRYHIFLIVLNALNNVLFTNIVYLLTKNLFRTFIIAVLSAVYYYASDNVIWINCSNNVICAFFYFLTVIASIKYNLKRGSFYLTVLIIFLNLALYSREMGVSLFLLLIIIDAIYFFDKKKIKNELKFFLKKQCLIFLFGFIYILVMALGPSFRYNKLSFDRGAYELVFDLKTIIVNINWFFFRTFIPFSLGSHFKLDLPHNIIQFIRFNYISIIIPGILLFIIRNRHYYFGILWVLITSAPYLLLNIYFVHTGERYFYLPHLGLGFILVGIWVYLQKFLNGCILKKVLKIFVMILLTGYSAVSIIGIQQRISYWIDAGSISYSFISEIKKTFSDIPDNSVLFIKDIPRWRNKQPKLIVLITGASFALNLYYDRKNIEVIPYWEDDKNNRNNFFEKNLKFDYYSVLEYKDGKILEWNVADPFHSRIQNFAETGSVKKLKMEFNPEKFLEF